MKKMLKKVISMLIVASLMIGITNIPAYAKVSTISTIKTTDAVLSKTYVTPSQAVKKALKSAKPTAKKAKATKKNTKKKAAKKVAKKAVSLTSQITKKYTKNGLKALQALANKFGFTLKGVYNQFVRYGVTKSQMKKVASGLINMINRGADFCVCSTLAVARYLGKTQAFTAVQQIAAEISLNLFDPKEKGHYISTSWTAQEKVLSKNKVKNADGYYVRTVDFLAMKKGTKMVVNVDCYNTKGEYDGCHAITVVREKNGRYGVYDILVNNGNKVIYNKTQFKKFLAGNSATGKTTSGRTITKNKYLSTADGYMSYKFVDDGKMYIVGNSTKIAAYYVRDSYNKCVTVINKLLKKKGVSKLARTWLKKVKNLATKILKGGKNNLDKDSWFNKANALLSEISKNKVSVVSVVRASFGTYYGISNLYNVFSSLKSVLKNNTTYKIYNKYGENGINIITEISKQTKLSQKVIYDQFVKKGVTTAQITGNVGSILLDNKKNIFKDYNMKFWKTQYPKIYNALAAIKKLAGK